MFCIYCTNEISLSCRFISLYERCYFFKIYASFNVIESHVSYSYVTSPSECHVLSDSVKLKFTSVIEEVRSPLLRKKYVEKSFVILRKKKVQKQSDTSVISSRDTWNKCLHGRRHWNVKQESLRRHKMPKRVLFDKPMRFARQCTWMHWMHACTLINASKQKRRSIVEQRSPARRTSKLMFIEET